MSTTRPATADDLAAITEVYNEAVLTTDATFDIRPRTSAEQEAWFADHGPRNPVIVAEENGTVIGWASLSKWSPRAAYADTCEVSVYVRESFRGRGTGRMLLEAVLLEGRKAGLHTVLARIVVGNEGGIRLHEGFGFVHVGVMREVGRKFGRLLDVSLMQKIYRH